MKELNNVYLELDNGKVIKADYAELDDYWTYEKGNHNWKQIPNWRIMEVRNTLD